MTSESEVTSGSAVTAESATADQQQTVPGGRARPRPVTISDRRLHPAYLVITLGRTVRSLIPVIAVGIWQAPGWTLAVLAGLVLLHSFALWWVRTYGVVEGALRVRGGLFKRTEDTIGLGRISSVDAERGLVQRLLRVWGVKIRTPGNDHRSSIHLPSLSGSALEELREALHQPVGGQPHATGPVNGAGSMERTVPTAPPFDESRVLAVLGNRTLLVAAVTGTSIPLILAGAVAALGRAHDILPRRTFDRIADRIFVGGSTTALILLGAVAVAVVAGITLTSLRLARFTLVREGPRLRITRGLLAQRSGTIPVDRVQAVRLVEGIWRRLLGYCALEVEVAGLSASNDSERMLFPLIRTSQAAELVRAALPELNWEPAPLRGVPARARRRYFTLPLLLAAVLTAAASRLPGWGAYLAFLPLPLAVCIGLAQAGAAAWSLDEHTVTFRWQRMLARHTVIAARRRVQLVEVTRTPFQRRADLAGTRLLLAPRRRARIRHLEASDATFLLHSAGRSARAATATYRGR